MINVVNEFLRFLTDMAVYIVQTQIRPVKEQTDMGLW